MLWGASPHNNLPHSHLEKRPDMDASIFTATANDWIRIAIDKHKLWIESQLGVSFDDALLLEVENLLASIPARTLMRNVPLSSLKQGPTEELRAMVTGVEYPSGILPYIAASFESRDFSENAAPPSESTHAWSLRWKDTPFALRFEGMSSPVVAMKLISKAEKFDIDRYIVVCRRDAVAEVMEILRQSNARQDVPVINTSVSEKKVKTADWDDLVLADSVRRLIRNDYESFFAREAWFRAHKLPFRRGYLLHGPPGNGKTSVIRAMLSRPGMTGFTMNFFSVGTDDSELEKLFDRAAAKAPSIIVLEDIDRAFPKNQSRETNRCEVSLQQLLNCLDGVGTQDGVIVVATANEPTALDPAILSRPGRFDRVVLFSNPSLGMRYEYLRKMNDALSDEAILKTVDLSDGFSFAQMREVYILAGQLAYEDGQDISYSHLTRSVRTMQKGIAASRRKSETVGFIPPFRDLPDYDEEEEFHAIPD